jgi:hypothetical protein
MRKVLARFPDEQAQPTLWLFPGEGVYLTHKDSPCSAIRICSLKQFMANCRVLVDQGWVLEKDEPSTRRAR